MTIGGLVRKLSGGIVVNDADSSDDDAVRDYDDRSRCMYILVCTSVYACISVCMHVVVYLLVYVLTNCVVSYAALL